MLEVTSKSKRNEKPGRSAKGGISDLINTEADLNTDNYKLLQTFAAQLCKNLQKKR